MRVLRREPGTVGIADLLLVVLIADAAQNAMAGEYHSILDGLILVLTIVFWNFFLDWLSLRSRKVERLTFPDPVSLFQNQRMNRRNMAAQFMTERQLLSTLREHGVEDLSKVKSVYMEGSGQISVILRKEEEEDDQQRKRNVA